MYGLQIVKNLVKASGAASCTIKGEATVTIGNTSVNGSTIGTLGNFSASTGKAKSKKTFNISAIVAAALKNDEVLKYSAYLPPNKRKILYVDTEQSKYHCHKVMERILRLAGLPTDMPWQLMKNIPARLIPAVS